MTTVDSVDELHQAFTKIQEKWKVKNSTEHLERLQQEFGDLKLGNGTVAHLINEIWEICEEHKILTNVVSYATKSSRLLRAMPEEYRTTIDN